MRRCLSYILAAVLCACCLSCRKKGEVIPRGELARIYAEMFILDEQIVRDRAVRRIADTSKVYEAVFAKYGYTSADYYASQEAYIKDAGRYAKMLKRSVKILEDEKKLLKKEKDRLDAIENAALRARRFAPHRLFLMPKIHFDSLQADSLMNFNFEAGLDTFFRGPRMLLKSELAVLDSLQAVSDSLQAAVSDSLSHSASLAQADSLVRADSLAGADSIARTDSVAGRKHRIIRVNDSAPKDAKRVLSEELPSEGIVNVISRKSR